MLERVSAGKLLWAADILSICVFSFVMAYNNKKVDAIVDVILLFVSKTSTFDSNDNFYSNDNFLLLILLVQRHLSGTICIKKIGHYKATSYDLSA